MSGEGKPRRRRTYLGRCLGTGERMKVYDTDDAVEIDNLEGYAVERRRVFYSDMLLITYNRSVNIFYAVATGIAFAIPLIVALSLLGNGIPVAATIVFLTLCLPLLILLLVLLGRPEARVTMFGKRGRAQMRWTFRVSRAEAAYQHLIARTAAVQEAERARIAARAPTPPSPFAPPPGAPGAAPRDATAAAPPSAPGDDLGTADHQDL